MTLTTAPLDIALEEGKAGQAPTDLRFLRLWQAANVFVCFGSFALSLLLFGSRTPSGSRPLAFLQPSGYTFGIWLVIIPGEFVLAVWQLLQCPGRAPEKRLAMICALSPGWCASGLFTALWGLTTNAYFDTVELRWISAALLSLAAVSLNFSHLAIASVTVAEKADWFLLKFPLTLHFGWGTAAALVTWNIYVARCTSSVGIKVAFTVLSVLAATAAGVILTLRRRTPLLGFTIAWALVGLGVEMLTSAALAEAMGSVATAVMGISELAMAAGQLAVCAYVIKTGPM